MAGYSAREAVTERDKDMGKVNKLKSIVPPVELCKRIPKDEFEETKFVWWYDHPSEYRPKKKADYVCFEAITRDDYEYKLWQIKQGADRRIPAHYPAPTLEEILGKLRGEVRLIKRISNEGELEFKIDDNSIKKWKKSAASAALVAWLEINE